MAAKIRSVRPFRPVGNLHTGGPCPTFEFEEGASQTFAVGDPLIFSGGRVVVIASSYTHRARGYRAAVSEYRFLSTWSLDAPIDAVFSAIDDCGSWPEWWQGMRRAELLEDAGQGGAGQGTFSAAADAPQTRSSRPSA